MQVHIIWQSASSVLVIYCSGTFCQAQSASTDALHALLNVSAFLYGKQVLSCGTTACASSATCILPHTLCYILSLLFCNFAHALAYTFAADLVSGRTNGYDGPAPPFPPQRHLLQEALNGAQGLVGEVQTLEDVANANVVDQAADDGLGRSLQDGFRLPCRAILSCACGLGPSLLYMICTGL